MAVHFYSHASRIVHHKSFRLPLVVFYVLPIFWFNLLFLACFVKSFLKGNVLQSESERGVNSILISILCFLKPFLKGKILRSSERGVNSILTTILRFWPTSWRDRIFCLAASDSARQKDHFQKKICPKRTFPSNFVKLVSKILYLFLAEKMVVCCLLLFVVVCCCLLQLCPILAYFFFKTLFKGKNFAVEWERGKFDFDHYFAFLTNFLKE